MKFEPCVGRHRAIFPRGDSCHRGQPAALLGRYRSTPYTTCFVQVAHVPRCPKPTTLPVGLSRSLPTRAGEPTALAASGRFRCGARSSFRCSISWVGGSLGSPWIDVPLAGCTPPGSRRPTGTGMVVLGPQTRTLAVRAREAVALVFSAGSFDFEMGALSRVAVMPVPRPTG